MHDVSFRYGLTGIVNNEWWLIQRQLRDGQTAICCFEGKRSARRPPEYVGRPTDRVDERGDILNLALDRVRLSVAAISASSSVEVDHRKVWCKQCRHWSCCRTVAQRAADEDNRWSRS